MSACQVCDRCNTRIYGEIFVVRIDIVRSNIPNTHDALEFDLCKVCYADLARFKNGNLVHKVNSRVPPKAH
jgi:hypothetical protein